jgi:hypothetical protein
MFARAMSLQSDSCVTNTRPSGIALIAARARVALRDALEGDHRQVLVGGAMLDLDLDSWTPTTERVRRCVAGTVEDSHLAVGGRFIG